LTRDARSAHEIAGDDLVNLVWTLLDQQASIFVDSDELSRS